METEGLLDYQARAGVIAIVRWNLRLVIFGVEYRSWPDLNTTNTCEESDPIMTQK